MRRTLLLLSLSAITLLANDLTITVDGFENDQGKLSVGLYIDAETFPDQDRVYLGQHVEISHNTAAVTFKDLAPQTYAMALYHDANDNGRLDKNFLGIPKEAYSFSKDAKGLFGPPSFDEAKFTLSEDTTFSISLGK